MTDDRLQRRVLAAIDPGELAADVGRLVAVPSPTGDERAALECLAAIARGHGIDATVEEHDLARLRAAPGHPGEEAPREELHGLTAVLPGRPGAPRLCLNGHVDVVGPGAAPWSRDPFSGAVADGFVHGRGSVDMKAGVIAALHAMRAVRRAGAGSAEVVLQAVASEEDGGLGTFAALERDARFDACLIPEPTGYDVIAAQAGALTFAGVVRGRSAHAAVRLEGCSAIDRYVDVHAALAAHERAINRDVAHPLMRVLALPYPVSVGRLSAGAWSSQVPDEARFEGRVGVRVGETPAQARAALEAAIGDGAEISWTGGQFEPGETPPDDPFVALVRRAAADELGREPAVSGVPYGSDMRLFRRHGIPCVMYGTPGIELAHAVDERVAVADVVRVARTIARVILRLSA